MDQPSPTAAAKPTSPVPGSTSISTAIVLQRRLDQSKKWAQPQWSACSIIVNETADELAPPTIIHEDETTTRFLFPGLILQLHKDGCEGYWYNLLSEEPRVFVVCEGEYGDEEIDIAFITANQDKATGLMESERLVLSIAMPEQMLELVERFVIAHYRPVPKKKRKRREWAEESAYAKKAGF